MRIRKIRFREEYRFKGRVIVVITVLLFIIIIPESNRNLIASFFSTRCRNNQPVYSKRLNDRLVDYSAEAVRTGIKSCENATDISKRVLSMQLRKVRNNRYYIVGDLTYSYPYLTGESRKLLNEIGRRFKERMNDEGLKGSRFIITSMTRTSENLRRLGRMNGNVSENSPHLNGNAFDISYADFSIFKFKVTECDKWFMKEALAEVIFELLYVYIFYLYI
jgi:hypothetical protein